MKKFWKKTEGFTLVELVVVIAILGILAGVGTVGYSGYVKKANMAADRQLVGYINQAYAVACVQNGMDARETNVNPIDISDKKMGEMDLTKPTGDKEAKILAAFKVNFPEYATAEFKIAKGIYFENGVFAADFDIDGGVYSGLTFDADNIALVKKSAFFNADGLGVNNLMGKVSYITGLASSLADVDDEGNGNGAWNMLVQYKDELIDALGITFPDNFDELDEDEQAAVMAPLYALVNAKIAAMEKQGVSGYENWDDDTKSQYAQNEILATFAVLDAAKKMKGQEADDVLAMIKSNSNFTQLIKDSEDGVSQAAAAYGLYTAYAYSIEDTTKREAAIAKANDPVALLKAMDEAEFRAYLDTDKAETDLAGYMAAMEMVDSSAGNEDAVYSLMVNGFTDPALLAVLQQAMK